MLNKCEGNIVKQRVVAIAVFVAFVVSTIQLKFIGNEL
jgi:hypothetical protein